jgi:hypothetical protein
MQVEKTEIWITCERPLTPFTDTDTILTGGSKGFERMYRNRTGLQGKEKDFKCY